MLFADLIISLRSKLSITHALHFQIRRVVIACMQFISSSYKDLRLRLLLRTSHVQYVQSCAVRTERAQSKIEDEEDEDV